MSFKYCFYTLSIFIVLNCISSCNSCGSFGETALGNKFALVETNEHDKSILYCTSSECCYAGITIVPKNVVSYKWDSKWIVAKSQDSGRVSYWIIDKEFAIEFRYDSGMREEIMSHVTGGLDAKTFNRELISRQIKLKLE